MAPTIYSSPRCDNPRKVPNKPGGWVILYRSGTETLILAHNCQSDSLDPDFELEFIGGWATFNPVRAGLEVCPYCKDHVPEIIQNLAANHREIIGK